MKRSVRPVPTITEMVALVIDAGSGSTAFFGYEMKPDGLYLQQDPGEYAEFVHYMASEATPSQLSLEIGIASGGQTKFLRDFYCCEQTIIVDLGQHPDAGNWPRIRKDLNSDLILEVFDDSHEPAVREALTPYRGRIDFTFVDGDHSYAGLRQDIFLVRELMRPGALMALHDTLGVPDCKRVYDELCASEVFEQVRDFDHRFGISLWRIGTPVASTEENRIAGAGVL